MFPDHRGSLNELFPLFFGNLEDSIPSVRQGAAAAIASVVKAYGVWVEWERVGMGCVTLLFSWLWIVSKTYYGHVFCRL